MSTEQGNSNRENPITREPEPEWTDDEKRVLRHEALIAEVMRFRKGLGDGTSKPRWLLFLESSGGTALIAAVLGAVLVQWVSGSIQTGLKKREFQQAWMQARGSQALTAYKEELDQEEQIIRRGYDLIGNAMQASEDLIDLTGPELSLSAYKGFDRKRIRDQRDRIRAAYNKSDVEWRGQREKLSLLIALYHHGRTGVISAWRNVQEDLTEYTDCAWKWYDSHDHESAEALKNACGQERQKLTGGLDGLTVVLEDARSKAREDWESPDKLIEKLEKANVR